MSALALGCTRCRQGGSFALAVALLLGLSAALCLSSLQLNRGVLVYALDDAYIHMAVARNLVEHGTWGTDRHEFAPVTSSLAWPLLVAGVFWLIGPADWVPLGLALASALGLLAAARWALLRAGTPPRLQLAALVLLLLATPMPALVLAGMEHLLHAALMLLLAGFAASRLTANEESKGGRRAAAGWDLGGLAALATATRYETLFFTSLVVLAFACQRRWRPALAVAAGSALPVVTFGVLSTAESGFFLPSSLLLKSTAAAAVHTFSLGTMLANWYARLAYTPELLVLLLAALLLALCASRERRWDDALRCGLFASTLAIHSLLASVGWLFRYEAYLVAMGVVAVLPPATRALEQALAANRLQSHRWLAAAVVGVALLPLCVRSAQALARTVPATHNIYCQHLQMARFVRDYLPGRTIALNDIGAVSFLTPATVVDLYGLADLEVATARLAGAYDSAWVAAYARRRNVDVAIVYEGALGGGVPPGWRRVGAWRLVRNVVCGDDTVLVFAVRPDSERDLRHAFTAFAATLPPAVQVRVD